MKDRDLEVTFRHGRPIAAYYYLPLKPDVWADMNQSETTRPKAIGATIKSRCLHQILATA